MDWARILAFVTGMVDQELQLRNEYLAAENRILKAQLKGRLRLSDAERATHDISCDTKARGGKLWQQPFFGVNALKFTNAQGVSKFGRYRIVPEIGPGLCERR